MLRRFGCPLCRYEARVLSNYKSEFDRLNVKMIAIGFDEVGLDEWVKGKFWDGDLYIDPELNIYNHFGLKKMGLARGLLSLFSSDFSKKMKLAEKLGVGGNYTKGNGFIMGGTYLIDKGGKVLFEFKQENALEYPSLKSIIKAAGGNPDIVKLEDENHGTHPSKL
ncbi:hypothetical protein DSO57_1027975 [Entomophthora muscae]|uniref:Uncharacterized protein n=1 Tax=Entomophthora muscae TaxID=34485 RepID=A0ACC2UN96_9FUNG|nr:hypothetical protein DSO57_1027975 [Entomophthora muscae]